MTYDETLKYIHSLERFGSKPGLERVEKLLSALGDPHKGLRYVHIAGTNGKGSTAAMTASVLRQAGYTTGLYISPYVTEFRERMQIDGDMISHEELCEVVQRVKDAAESLKDHPTEFEIITAAALLWYNMRGCDIVVLEVGLGGRFDATNVIPAPLVSVITAIDLDHTQVLGDTVEEIAHEKCGIIKAGSMVVSYPRQHPDALAVVMEHCAVHGVSLEMSNPEAVDIHRCDLGGSRFTVGDYEIDLPLIGRHQIDNCLTVLSIIQALGRCGFGVSKRDVVMGIAATAFPSRMEILRKQPLVILDGAHNPAGARALSAAIPLLGERPITAICGMLGDKQWREAVAFIAPHCKELYALTPKNPRALHAKELAEEASKYCHSRACEDITTAWNLAEQSGNAILIWGSLYLASEMREHVLCHGTTNSDNKG